MHCLWRITFCPLMSLSCRSPWASTEAGKEGARVWRKNSGEGGDDADAQQDEREVRKRNGGK